MKRRVRILHPGFLVGTKGHSVLKKKTYARKPLVEVEEFYPLTMPISRRHEVDSDYNTMGSFHNASGFASAVMDDSYDLQHQSRGRDHRLLNSMNDALVTTDLRRTPKSAVAVLRATRRPISVQSTHYPRSKEVPYTGPIYMSSSARYIPGRTKRIIGLRSYSPRVCVDDYGALYPRSTKYLSFDPVHIKRRAATRTSYPDLDYLPWYAGWRAVARGRYLRSVPRIYYGRTYQLPDLPLKALLVGEDKLDDPDRPRSRKPRSRYYTDKVKKMEDQEHLSSLMATPTPHSIHVRASSAPRKPVLPTYPWRPIHDVDGYTYTTPTNLMSWQYRLESRLAPEDLISKPVGYGKMRTQLTDVQDKMDHHRQLMDRHTDRADSGLATGGSLSATRTTDEGGAGGAGGEKVSPLRKKLRKVICKSRHDPSYYDE